jgi:hypothetical protein
VWQQLRQELHPHGLELVTVGIDAAGAEACRSSIEAAAPQHPSLIDTHHLVAEQFGVTNVPNGVWIDEDGMIVRPAETAPAPPGKREFNVGDGEIPERLRAIFTEAAGIVTSRDEYHAALRDWVENGSESEFAMTPDQVIARSEPRDADAALGAAHFEMAAHMVTLDRKDLAIEHFREAHRLVPDNFTYKRQAWSLEGGVEGPLERFWQGPSDGVDWPYEGDWLTDVREMGAENYYRPFTP